MSSVEPLARRRQDAASPPSLRLVTTPPARTDSSWVPNDEQPIELKLGFRQLALIYSSLEAIRTLGLVERQDDLLTDTLQLIDAALAKAV
jgi:hypothetical protein